MSGANAALTARDRRFRDLSNLNADLIVGAIKVHCAEHPGAQVAQGVEAFWAVRPARTFGP